MKDFVVEVVLQTVVESAFRLLEWGVCSSRGLMLVAEN
jgi:hypothetical protein